MSPDETSKRNVLDGRKYHVPQRTQRTTTTDLHRVTVTKHDVVTTVQYIYILQVWWPGK